MANIRSLSALPRPWHASVQSRPCSAASLSPPGHLPPSPSSSLCRSSHRGHSPCPNFLLLWRFSGRRSCFHRLVWESTSSTVTLRCSLCGHWQVWYAQEWPSRSWWKGERAGSALLLAFQPRYLCERWRDAFCVIRPGKRARTGMPPVMVWPAVVADWIGRQAQIRGSGTRSMPNVTCKVERAGQHVVARSVPRSTRRRVRANRKPAC